MKSNLSKTAIKQYWIWLSALLLFGCSSQAKWQPAENPLLTRWAEKLTVDNVHQEYPRPQMVREDWLNLNGLWDYAIRPRDENKPMDFDGQILVPFPIESALSGVKKEVGRDNRLWYKRKFEIPAGWTGKRMLLHFGAVDWDTTVWVNGKKVGTHRGCYDPFTFDVTEALNNKGSQEVVLSVWDQTDNGTQPRGKQVTNPKGIYYTSVTGIWQSVWLEPVPDAHIEKFKIIPDIDAGVLRLTVHGANTKSQHALKAIAKDGAKIVASATGNPAIEFELKIPGAKLWSPDSPFLYDLNIYLEQDGQTIDTVTSYFGMRKISVGKDEYGFNRLMLNNKPLFQYGPLDQGWWPDGLYTAPTDEALRYDLDITRKMGFNMLRKHVKIEPARFYYHCDRLGILVWQDMPNGNDRSLRVKSSDPKDANRDPESAKQFEAELKAMIDNLYNHPSIVTWVLFNEGWGQYDTKRLARWLKQYDSTRISDAASGWADRGVSDMYDAHLYPGPGMEDVEPERVTVLGEYGGLGLPVEGHLWVKDKSWGYRSFKTKEALAVKYESLLNSLYGMIGRGLSAAVYTQTTDVESEVNGLMTYDREVIKFDTDKMARLHQKLYKPVQKMLLLLEDSEHTKQQWRYSFEQPSSDWITPEYQDQSWQNGPAPFALKPNAYFDMGTQWKDKDIYLRKSFQLETLPRDLRVKVYFEVTEATVFINGKKVLELERRAGNHYQDIDVSEHAEVLQKGTNVIAVHCSAGEKMQGFDIGLYGVNY